MQENTPAGGVPSGEQQRTNAASGDAQKVKEHLRAAGTAAGEALRGRAHAATDTVKAATDTARARAHDAGDWARTRWSSLQSQVESRPGMAALWALGIGLAAGLLISALGRGRRY